jgi:hypothetical protein
LNKGTERQDVEKSHIILVFNQHSFENCGFAHYVNAIQIPYGEIPFSFSIIQSIVG